MLLQLQELDAFLAVATQLFPLVEKVVTSIEAMAPHAPGPSKLDTAMSITKQALTAAGNDADVVAKAAAIAPSMIGLAKAQYNATLANVQANQPIGAS
jgi:hypothetical protein